MKTNTPAASEKDAAGNLVICEVVYEFAMDMISSLSDTKIFAKVGSK